MTLTLSPDLRARIVGHAEREAPRECCGLLLGRGDVVVDVVAARNELPGTTAYQIDARDHFAAIRRARADGMAVLGAFHSHPRSAPVPSARDLAEAWPDFIYVIVSLAPPWCGQPMRAWRLDGGNFVEVPLVTPTEESAAPCQPESPLPS